MRFSMVATLSLCSGLLAGCESLDSRYINPPRIDQDAAKLQGTGLTTFMPNAELYIGTFDKPTADLIRGGTFAQAWGAAAQSAKKVNDAADDATRSTENTKSTALAKVFLMRGIAVSDRLCAQWFDRLAKAQAEIAVTRDLVSGIGGLTAGLAALSGATTAATGAIAAGTGFGNAMLGSLDVNFVMAADVGIVQQLVVRQRQNVANQLNTANNYTYETAMAALANYETSCSHQAVKSLVNQSVANSNVATGRDYSDLLLASLAAQIQTFFDPAQASVAATDVVALYAVLVKADRTSTFLDQLKKDRLFSAASTVEAPDLTNLRSGNSASNRPQILLLLNSPGYQAALDAALAAAKPKAAAAAVAPGAPAPSPAPERTPSAIPPPLTR